jgi:predicted metal-binding protein
MSQGLANRLLVCATCERIEGHTARADCAVIREALDVAGLSEQISVEATPCLGGCVAPVNISLQGVGRGSFVFDGLDVKAFEAEIVKLCEMYLELDNGWIEDARPLGELRNCLRARIPAQS